MINENENFNGTWPFKAKFFTGNGFRQHYVEVGNKKGKLNLKIRNMLQIHYLKKVKT